MEYTKGEWKTHKNALGEWTIATDTEYIGQISRHFNAQLIASAPDQNLALTDIVKFVKDNPFIGKDEERIILDKAMPALAKAGGK